MPVTPTTKLDAVNYLLSIVGEAPVVALNTDENASASVALATELIDEVDRMVQSRGWGFNTASLFQFNKSGSEFPVTSDTLRVNILATLPTTTLIQRFVLKGQKIYDSTYGTSVNPVIPGTSTQYTALIGERVFLIDFTDLPQAARQYITIRAGRMFLQRVLPDEASNKISEIDEQMAFAMLIEWDVKSGRSNDYSKFSTELEALGINLAVFTNASIEDKSKLVKLSGESLTERQGRDYYEVRIKGKTTLTTDTYAAYKDNFNRLGITEKDFIQLDPILREELMVIAKNTTTTADTRASKFFQSTNASKASKLGVRYSDFLKFSREEQQVFLDGVASLSEDRFSRFISVKSKADKIGVRITDFFAYKPEEQEIFLDALASANYSDTRATDYVTRKASLDRLGIKPNDFFALKQEDQANLLEAVSNVNFTDTRVSTYISNQAKLKTLGIYPTDFFGLTYDQQALVLSAVSDASYTETRASTYVTNRDKLRKLNINAVDFFALKPDQQNQLLSVVADTNFDETRANNYIANQSKLKKIGVSPVDFFNLKPDQQFLLLEAVTNANWSDTRYQTFLTNVVDFKLKSIALKDFLGLKPEDQQNLIENISSLESLINSGQVATFEASNPIYEHLNDIVMMVGLNPLSSLSKDYAYKANFIFTQVLKEVQSMGWHYNTDTNVTLTPTSGRIIAPSNALALDVDKTTYFEIDPVIRYDTANSQYYVWDKIKDTWLNQTIVAEVIRELDIRSVPSLILKYAKVKAAKELANNLNTLTNSPDLSVKNAYLMQEELKAKADAIEQDSKQGDYSIFDNYSVSSILDR